MSERKSPAKSVVVVIGAETIGQAIARRISAGKSPLGRPARRERQSGGRC